MSKSSKSLEFKLTLANGDIIYTTDINSANEPITSIEWQEAKSEQEAPQPLTLSYGNIHDPAYYTDFIPYKPSQDGPIYLYYKLN